MRASTKSSGAPHHAELNSAAERELRRRVASGARPPLGEDRKQVVKVDLLIPVDVGRAGTAPAEIRAFPQKRQSADVASSLGLVADRRADVWAFGVVVWEMLTGERLFAGDSVSDTLAGVLQWVAATAHFQNSARGILDSRDLLYFLSGSFLFLHFTDRLMRGRG